MYEKALVKRGLWEEPQPPKIGLGPAGLIFDHALEGFEREGIAGVMKRHRHTPAIGVTVSLMAAHLGMEEEAVANEGADDLPSGQTAQLTIVNGHALDRDGNQRLLRDLDILWNRLAILP